MLCSIRVKKKHPKSKPQLLAIDVLDIRTRPCLEIYHENCRSQNKITCVEFGKEDVVIVSDKDNQEIKMHDRVRGVLEGPVTVRKEAMTVAKKMTDKIAQRISLNNQEYALKMVFI